MAVVCSPYSSLRQIITEAECGAAFIRLLQTNQTLAEQMGKAGREYLQSHFTPQIICQQYLEVLLQTANIKKSKTF